MRKVSIMALALLVVFLLTGCFGLMVDMLSGSEDDDDWYYSGSTDIKPPLGLVAYPGDQSVTLSFYSANNENERVHFWGFAAHMAEGDYSAGKVPGSYYDDPDAVFFDNYGDGKVCGGEGCEGETNGLQPIAYIEGGIDEVESALGVKIPGLITWLIQDGDNVPVLGDVGDDDDDATADDDDDIDKMTAVYPAATSSDDTYDDDNYYDPDTSPSITGGGTLTLDNGHLYTIFVVTRAEEGKCASWTSNYTTFVPRPESEELTLSPGQDTLCALSDSDGLDLGENGIESFAVGNFDSCEGFYYGSTTEETKIDLAVVTSGSAGYYGLEGVRPYLVSTNGNIIQDLGYYEDWVYAADAPEDVNTYVVSGTPLPALAGHVYGILTVDGHFAKVQVKNIDETFHSVTMIAAYQKLYLYSTY